MAHQEAASVSAGEVTSEDEAAEVAVETRLSKAVVTDTVISHMSSVLNVTNTATTRRSAAAT